jgi:hypothetical protein
MTRQQKYPDTATFQFFNANPQNRMGGDCVVRALCTALGQSWEQTVRELTELGIKHGYVLNDPALFPKYLERKGWVKKSQPRKRDNTKYTGAEFCQALQAGKEFTLVGDQNRIIANLGGHHTVAIIDGRVLDIWDSTDGCIGNWWVKVN